MDVLDAYAEHIGRIRYVTSHAEEYGGAEKALARIREILENLDKQKK